MAQRLREVKRFQILSLRYLPDGVGASAAQSHKQPSLMATAVHVPVHRAPGVMPSLNGGEGQPVRCASPAALATHAPAQQLEDSMRSLLSAQFNVLLVDDDPVSLKCVAKVQLWGRRRFCARSAREIRPRQEGAR